MWRTSWLATLIVGCGGPHGGPDAAVTDATVDGPAVDATAIDAAPYDPVRGAALTGLELFDGWTDPRTLTGDVNTTGWEDSPFIAADGQTLYFGYTRWDFDALSGPNPAIVITGPPRAGQHGDAFDIWEARLGPTGFVVASSTANAGGDVPEAAAGVDRAETRMVFARFVGPGELYQSTRATRGQPWTAPVALPAPIASPCIEDNPTLTPDGQLLFFDTDRADATGSACKPGGQPRDLYVAAKDGAGWAAPTRVVGTPNQGVLRQQPFATESGATLYWSGANAADCTGTYSCVYRATRQGDGSYAGATLVARATHPRATAADGDVVALGEVSITDDGRWLYFVYMQRVDASSTDLSIGVARHQ